MKIPKLSQHYKDRSPSAIRSAYIDYSYRADKESVEVINLAIGNISLPMYPSMHKRMKEIGEKRFADGVVGYTPTVGNKETIKAFLNVLQAEGIDTSNIYPNITDGGSSAMELMMLGVCGPACKKPIMLLDPVYTNYLEFAKRLAIEVVTTARKINNDGSFASINIREIESNIKQYKPKALVVIPYDNPTGQFINQEILIELARICIQNNIWLVSDEAYRPLYYKSNKQSSIWLIDENKLPDIKGRRISIESSSKIWNACGLRIGALLTDNKEFHHKAVSEYTANLCANAIGQEIFGVLANESHEKIQKWYKIQRDYYQDILLKLKKEFQKELPGLIVSEPEAALYFIIDFKNIADSNFESIKFVQYCAKKGKVQIEGKFYTLLLAPMDGFYLNSKLGNTQLRIAIVETPKKMLLAPKVLSKLFVDYSK